MYVFTWIDPQSFSFYTFLFISFKSTLAYNQAGFYFLTMVSWSHSASAILSLSSMHLDVTLVFVSLSCHTLIPKCLIPPAVCAACAAHCVFTDSLPLLVHFFILSVLKAARMSRGYLIPPVTRDVGQLDDVTNLANADSLKGSTHPCVARFKLERMMFCIFPSSLLRTGWLRICQMVSTLNTDQPYFLQKAPHFFLNAYGLGFQNPLHPL